jgi:hypothetical protein
MATKGFCRFFRKIEAQRNKKIERRKDALRNAGLDVDNPIPSLMGNGNLSIKDPDGGYLVVDPSFIWNPFTWRCNRNRRKNIE